MGIKVKHRTKISKGIVKYISYRIFKREKVNSVIVVRFI